MSDEKPMGQVIQIDEARVRDHLGELVRDTVEDTLNAMLDAEADQLCGAGRYERSQARSVQTVVPSLISVAQPCARAAAKDRLFEPAAAMAQGERRGLTLRSSCD